MPVSLLVLKTVLVMPSVTDVSRVNFFLNFVVFLAVLITYCRLLFAVGFVIIRLCTKEEM